MKTPALTLALTLTLALLLQLPHAHAEHHRADLVVYGATPSGICAAIAARRSGLDVLLVEASNHLGGMLTSGLSNSDVSRSEVIGGLALEAFQRIAQHYGNNNTWRFEPHVALQTCHTWLAEESIPLHLNQPLAHVQRHHNTIQSFTTIPTTTTTNTTNNTYSATVFIDASYEGDLMARAGVSYTYGREAIATFNEPLAGSRSRAPEAQWPIQIQARKPDGAIYPEVHKINMTPPGHGDVYIPAYNYRLCLTTNAANRVAFTQPPNYDPARFELLTTLFQRQPNLQLTDLFWLFPLPNHKFDINTRGPFSSNLLGGSWKYPEASHTRRHTIATAHRTYLQQLLWFLAHHPSVPQHIRTQLQPYGYARDEFTDHQHFPPQLYIREARRMRGAHILTQHDILQPQPQPDTIGYGAHRIESHHVIRLVMPDGVVYNRGDLNHRVPMRPYPIPYRILTPLPSEAHNLLVTVCLSATHIAYSSIRMEPQYMITGHAAGTAAALAIQTQTPVQNIHIPTLQNHLRSQSQILP